MRTRVAALLPAILAVALAAPGSAARGGDGHGLTTFRDAADGFTVRFPDTWRRATRSLTPHLTDPREILSVGTGRFTVDEARCAQVPVGAMQALGPDDVLVTVFERRGRPRGFARRPRPFTLPPANASEAIGCLADPGPRRTYWTSFRDRGRGFYVLVAVGSRRAPRRLAQARRVIDSLRFDAR